MEDHINTCCRRITGKTEAMSPMDNWLVSQRMGQRGEPSALAKNNPFTFWSIPRNKILASRLCKACRPVKSVDAFIALIGSVRCWICNGLFPSVQWPSIAPWNVPCVYAWKVGQVLSGNLPGKVFIVPNWEADPTHHRSASGPPNPMHIYSLIHSQTHGLRYDIITLSWLIMFELNFQTCLQTKTSLSGWLSLWHAVKAEKERARPISFLFPAFYLESADQRERESVNRGVL